MLFYSTTKCIKLKVCGSLGFGFHFFYELFFYISMSSIDTCNKFCTTHHVQIFIYNGSNIYGNVLIILKMRKFIKLYKMRQKVWESLSIRNMNNVQSSRHYRSMRSMRNINKNVNNDKVITMYFKLLKDDPFVCGII